MSFVIDLGPVFKRVDNAIQRINQWITVKKTYCAIHRITIYPVDSVIQPTQEKQRAICDVSTRTCYNSGAIEKFMLLKRSATKKKQWDREGESGFWPGYIYSTSIFFESSLSFFYQVAFIAKGISALPAISPSIVI